MKKLPVRLWWKWCKIIVSAYVIIGTILFLLQDRFIFHPRKLAADYQFHFDVPFTQVDLPTQGDRNLSIVKFHVQDTTYKGIVLYFHGNRTNINRYAPNASLFTSRGYEVWMMDYPGYGKTTGKRTEQVIYEDALQVYKMAMKLVPAEQIILYGKSLGTGVASQLASVRDCRHLVLETPYYSMDALAKHYFFIYPVIPLSKFSFPTYSYIENTRAPITIFHGTKDAIIPYQHATWLKAIKPSIELVTIPKGKHNNLPRYPVFLEKLDSLLAR